MTEPYLEHTSATLPARVGSDPSDQVAWATFVDRYGPKINHWCRQRGLQQADAEDVTQNVLLRLARALKTFNYDPSKTFRGWLRQITEHALSDFFLDCKRRREARDRSDDVLEAPASVEARDELMDRLEQEFAREMLSQACAVVCTRVEPRTWEAFQLTACEGRSGEEVAEQLGMAVTAVFKAKSRVLSLIREEVKRLDGGAG